MSHPSESATGMSPSTCLHQETQRDAHQKLNRGQSVSIFTEEAGVNACIAPNFEKKCKVI